MTYTPRHVIDSAVEDIDLPSTLPCFDPASGVHPDFDAANVAPRQREAEDLNRGPIRTAEALPTASERLPSLAREFDAESTQDRSLEVANLRAQLMDAAQNRPRPPGWIGPIAMMVAGAFAAIAGGMWLAG